MVTFEPSQTILITKNKCMHTNKSVSELMAHPIGRSKVHIIFHTLVEHCFITTQAASDECKHLIQAQSQQMKLQRRAESSISASWSRVSGHPSNNDGAAETWPAAAT